jgi:hypothetical protein
LHSVLPRAGLAWPRADPSSPSAVPAHSKHPASQFYFPQPLLYYFQPAYPILLRASQFYYDAIYATDAAMRAFHAKVNADPGAVVGPWDDEGVRILRFVMPMNVPAMLKKFIGEISCTHPLNLTRTLSIVRVAVNRKWAAAPTVSLWCSGDAAGGGVWWWLAGRGCDAMAGCWVAESERERTCPVHHPCKLPPGEGLKGLK